MEKLPTPIKKRSIIEVLPLPVLDLLMGRGKTASKAGNSTTVYTKASKTPIPANTPRSAIGATSEVENESNPLAVVTFAITTASPEWPKV